MRPNLSNLKPGDKVWLGSSNWPKSKILPVFKITPTQVVLRPHGPETDYEQRFKIDGGRRIGGSTGAFNINGIPDAWEIVEYDKKQDVARRKQEEAKAEQSRLEATRTALQGRFPEVIRPGILDDGKTLWQVTFYGLTESEVRLLADRLIGWEKS